jgi:hypothetical protein
MAWDIPGMAILPVWVISPVDALDSRFCNSGDSENQNIGRFEGKKFCYITAWNILGMPILPVWVDLPVCIMFRVDALEKYKVPYRYIISPELQVVLYSKMDQTDSDQPESLDRPCVELFCWGEGFVFCSSLSLSLSLSLVFVCCVFGDRWLPSL